MDLLEWSRIKMRKRGQKGRGFLFAMEGSTYRLTVGLGLEGQVVQDICWFLVLGCLLDALPLI